MDIQGVAITPFGSISYINLHTDAVKEKGGFAALSSSADTMETTFTTLGFRTAVPVSDKVRINGLAGWRHAFGDIDPQTVFTLDESDPFRIQGAPIAEDSFVTEIGFDFAFSDSFTASASYRGQFGDGVEMHSAVARARKAF